MMRIDDIDTFRANFFEKVIQDEKAKQIKLKLAQKRCFHRYIPNGTQNELGQHEVSCSKCGHSTIKSLVYTQPQNCVIA